MANEIDAVTQLLQQLGGTKTVTSPGNTGGLDNVLAQLQAQNATGYQGLLESIFQQAAGAIPGMQNAFSSAVGARGGTRNSAMQTALSQLLKDATLQGQKQLVDQQNTNLAAQVQAGNGIAQATKGTTVQAGTNLGNAAKNLAILQALSKLSKEDSLGGMFKSMFSTSAPVVDGGMVNPVEGFVARQPDYAGPVEAAAPAFQQDYSPLADFNPDSYTFDAPATDSPSTGAPEDYTNLFADQSPSAGIEEFLQNLDMNSDGYASGGRVKKGFASGGSVTQYAAGSRRSSAPTIATASPTYTATNNDPAAESTVAPPTPVVTPPLSAIVGGTTITDTLNNSSRGGNINFQSVSPSDAATNRKVLGTISDLNSASGMLGNSTIPGLGLISSLARAKTDEDALKSIGLYGLNMAIPGVGTAASIASNPTAQNIIDSLSMLNPVSGIINLGMKTIGDTSIGQQLVGTPQSINKVTGDVTNPTAGILGAGGLVGGTAGDDFAASFPVTAYGPVTGVPLGGISGSGGNYSFGSHNSDRGPGGSSGDTGASEGGASASGPGYSAGGDIEGAGTGTSDSIDTQLSDGETVITAQTSKLVRKVLGDSFFHDLERMFNPKAAAEQVRMGRA